MSVCVTIRTDKTVSPLSIRSSISTLHPGIEIPDCGETTSHFYVPGKSIRAVELTKEDNGYEVRILIHSSRYDWSIFRDLISQLLYLTDGKAYLEDDDDTPVNDVYLEFSDEIIAENLNNDYSSTKVLSRKDNVIIFCVNRWICMGDQLYKLAGIDDSTPDDDAANLLEKYLLSVQWDRPGHVSTEPPECFAKMRDKDGQMQKVSIYLYSDDNPDRYDYIHYEPFFSIYDADNKDGVVIDYAELHKIAPSSWSLFDREQYDCKPLTRAEFNDFMAKAKKYDIRNNADNNDEDTSELDREPDIRHIHIDTENTRVAVDVSSGFWDLKQGNTLFHIPKFIEFQLIYLLYRRKNRISAAKLLQSSFMGEMNVEDALDVFEKTHTPEPLTQPFALSDLEPLANPENGLSLLSEGQKVTISAKRENELLKLLIAKNQDGLVSWFENYLIANGYDFTRDVMHKHAINLSTCYFNFQCLDTDENDPFFGYDKKKGIIRFWLVMIVLCSIIMLSLIILIK